MHFVLGAVGELPETEEHANGERTGLRDRLHVGQELIGEPAAALIFDFGGDIVRGTVAMVSEQRVDMIVIPGGADTQSEDILTELRERTDLPARVLQVARSLASVNGTA